MVFSHHRVRATVLSPDNGRLLPYRVPQPVRRPEGRPALPLPPARPYLTPAPATDRGSEAVLRGRLPPHWDAPGLWLVRQNKATSVVHGVQTASQCGGFDAPRDAPSRARVRMRRQAHRGGRGAACGGRTGKENPGARPGVLGGRGREGVSPDPCCTRLCHPQTSQSGLRRAANRRACAKREPNRCSDRPPCTLPRSTGRTAA